MVRIYIIRCEQHTLSKHSRSPAGSDRQQQMLVATLIIAVVLVVSAWPAAAAATPLPTPYGNDSCQRRCGDLEIPYPFGIGRGCYHYTGEGDITFQLTCRLTAGGGYHYQSVEVTDINVRRGEARVRNDIQPWCYNRTSRSMGDNSLWWTDLSDSQFRLSDEGNRFVVVGCNSLAYVQSVNTGTVYMKGCMATCPDAGTLVNRRVRRAHATCWAREAYGYLDPECMQTSKLTSKSDVYSFGVVLLELLTCRNLQALDDDEINLSAQFLRAMGEKRLDEILDEQIKGEQSMELIEQVAELAKQCLEI